MSHDDASLAVEQEVASQLQHVSLGTEPDLASAEDGLEVIPDDLWRVGSHEASIQSVSFVDSSLGIQKQGKIDTRFIEKDPGPVGRTEGDEGDLNAPFLKCLFEAAQLRRVIASGQSSQMAQEDQQHRSLLKK